MWAWGRNSEGQLGTSTATGTSTTPIQVSGISGVSAIAVGDYHSAALKPDGTVWSWGGNLNGQLGDGSNTDRSTPVQASGLSNVVFVGSTNGNFNTALKSDGTVWTWGYNYYGQLGNGTTVDSNTPVQVSSLNLRSPTVATGAATSVSTNSATLNGTVNANGTSTTAWFNYSTTSGSYTGTSTTQAASGTSTTSVSIGLSSLSASTTYYYRIAGQSSYGTSYGSETSFTTSSSPPVVEPPPPSVSYITVTSKSPSSGATSVSTNTVITATFSDTMNGSTLTTDTFKLSGGGNDVAGSVGTNGNKATFTPSASLAYDTTYTATITTGAQAANYAGTTLDSNYSWSFTTASAPAVPTPTPTVTTSPSPTPTATQSPTPTPSPTSAGISAELHLSKEVAYLSGDTVVVTVVDADRDTNTTSEDTLTTALKVTALNYFAGGDLTLDMKENAVNSGTFLATIKTGTTTSGDASASTRVNIGTIKTVQGGTATVTYTDTAPNASTITKTLSFSSSDATLKFDAESYAVGSYAAVTHIEAEENKDATKVDILLNHAVIETSSLNRAWMKLAETGADTGMFKGSILVSNDATLDNERIQASNGDTLAAGCTDEINTSGAPRWITAVSRVVSAGKMTLFPDKLQLSPNTSSEVTVTVTGTNGSSANGKQVTAKVMKGRNSVTVSPASQELDEDGQAVFTIKAKDKTWRARVTFRVDELWKSMSVRVKK